MPNDHFSRLLRLAQKTGDRLIVTDANGGEPVVILPLDEYESLIENALGLSEGYEIPSTVDVGGADDEAEFDAEELQRGMLRDLWQEPVLETAPLEVIERPEPEIPPVQPIHEPEPVPEPAPQPAVRRPIPPRPLAPKPPRDEGEEQFYLEPV